jgi:hypothetical protein
MGWNCWPNQLMYNLVRELEFFFSHPPPFLTRPLKWSKYHLAIYETNLVCTLRRKWLFFYQARRLHHSRPPWIKKSSHPTILGCEPNKNHFFVLFTLLSSSIWNNFEWNIVHYLECKLKHSSLFIVWTQFAL